MFRYYKFSCKTTCRAGSWDVKLAVYDEIHILNKSKWIKINVNRYNKTRGVKQTPPFTPIKHRIHSDIQANRVR
jgi:hypothetical protein